jgi:hypothetical protein
MTAAASAASGSQTCRCRGRPTETREEPAADQGRGRDDRHVSESCSETEVSERELDEHAPRSVTRTRAFDTGRRDRRRSRWRDTSPSSRIVGPSCERGRWTLTRGSSGIVQTSSGPELSRSVTPTGSFSPGSGIVDLSGKTKCDSMMSGIPRGLRLLDSRGLASWFPSLVTLPSLFLSVLAVLIHVACGHLTISLRATAPEWRGH